MIDEISTNDQREQTLTIRQQNLNKSSDATLSMINTVNPLTTDIIAIQEPYFDRFNNTRATRAWKVVTPSKHMKDGEERSRAIILVNTKIKEWDQINIDSPDAVGIKVKTDMGQILIINIYCDIAHSRTLHDAMTATVREVNKIRGSQAHVLWMGDFNRHHPRWDELRNSHLFTHENLDKAQILINCTDDLGLQMILPRNLPTLKAMATGNYTRPDNVFASPGIVERLASCKPIERETPPRTDHFPIVTRIVTSTAKTVDKEIFNFKETDWKEFRKDLQPKLANIPTSEVIETRETFNNRLKALTEAIQGTISKVVPRSKITRYAKRWWTKELTELHRELKKIRNRSKKRRHDTQDPIHEALRVAQNKFTQEIRNTKRDHWDDFLASVDERTMWNAHKYVTGDPTDGSASKTLALKKKKENGTVTYTENDEEKANLLFRTFFPDIGEYQKPPTNYKYPPSKFEFREITDTQIHKAIERLKPYKAPGSNGIPNVVLKKTAQLIVPIIGPLFRATFRIGYFPQEWKDSEIIVLRKPGKPDYAEPNAYRPIALLDTIGKVLSSCVSEDLLAFAEKYSLLPPTQFGCRPGHTTTDALQHAMSFIKNAWRGGEEVAALFLDIKAAFPSVLPEWLAHGMRKRGVPQRYTDWLTKVMSGRKTALTFDNYKSQPLDLKIGLDQGRPESGPCFAFYNAALADLAKDRKDVEVIIFADDTTLLARAKTLEEAVKTLQDLMNGTHGASQWAKEHNCKFATEKFALMGFSRRREADSNRRGKSVPRKRPPIKINGMTIKPTHQHRFLGVLMDEELRFTAHADYALQKGSKWVSQFRRLTKLTKGTSTKHMRRFYLAVAVPKMLYAADVFLAPAVSGTRGVKGIIKKLTRVQREAAIAVTGALRTTASDVLDAHANFLPFDLLVEKVIVRAGTRLATIPDSHVLHKPIQRAAKRNVKKHRSPLHDILHGSDIDPNTHEKIKPSIWGPKWTSTHEIEIETSRETAVQNTDKYRDCRTVYSDGSCRDGMVGAAAIYWDSRGRKHVRRKLLGSEEEHTVYEAELVGISLALDIAKSIRSSDQVLIMLDNQAAIQATQRQRAVPGQHLVEHIQKQIKSLLKAQRKKIKLIWTPGHEGIEGNEEADKEAAKAITDGDLNSEHLTYLQELPISRSAARQARETSLKRRAAERWEGSPRGARMREIDNALPGTSFLKLTNKFPRRNTSILMQLRTGHIPLNHFLYKIGKAESPLCQACELEREDVSHYLMKCPRHDRHRLKMQQYYRQHIISKKTLLASPKAMKYLFEFVNKTKRFETPYGTFDEPKTTNRGKNSKRKRNPNAM